MQGLDAPPFHMGKGQSFPSTDTTEVPHSLKWSPDDFPGAAESDGSYIFFCDKSALNQSGLGSNLDSLYIFISYRKDSHADPEIALWMIARRLKSNPIPH